MEQFSVIFSDESGRRSATFFAEGGVCLERHQPGFGWVLDEAFPVDELQAWAMVDRLRMFAETCCAAAPEVQS